MSNLLPLITGVILILTALGTFFGLAWLSARKDKETEDRVYFILSLVRVAVAAAEQLNKISELEKAERRPYAVEFVESELEKLGISVDVNIIIAYIESVILARNENDGNNGSTLGYAL